MCLCALAFNFNYFPCMARMNTRQVLEVAETLLKVKQLSSWFGFAVATASDYDCTNGSGLSKSLGGKIRVLHRLWMSRTNPLTLTKAKETGGGVYSLVVVFRLMWRIRSFFFYISFSALGIVIHILIHISYRNWNCQLRKKINLIYSKL